MVHFSLHIFVGVEIPTPSGVICKPNLIELLWIRSEAQSCRSNAHSVIWFYLFCCPNFLTSCFASKIVISPPPQILCNFIKQLSISYFLFTYVQGWFEALELPVIFWLLPTVSLVLSVLIVSYIVSLVCNVHGGI